MRFRFVEPNTPDARVRAAMESRFDQFWAAVRDEAGALVEMLRSRGPVAEWMNARLPMRDLGVEWEIGPDAGDGWKLVVTSADGGARGLRPAVDRLLELAPTIPGWTFAAHRQPEPADVAAMLLDGRTNGRAAVIESPRFRVADGPHGLLAIECLADNGGDEAAHASAAMLVEILVGERDFDAWVGPIGFVANDGGDSIAPGELRAAVGRKIATRVATLPGRPRSALSANELQASFPDVPKGEDGWTAYELRPQPADVGDDDYSGGIDRHFATVREPSLFTATLAPGFDSRRFSRAGERFAYLKIEHLGVWLPEHLIDQREALFDWLDRALRTARVGSAWGNASGGRYAYIELALTDIDAAIPLIRDAAHDAGIGPRSWLLFHDADWRDEWVGLTRESPAPPRAAEPR